MLKNIANRFLAEEDGMEMIEWAIVAIFFAVAGATIWGEVSDALRDGLQNNVITLLR